MSNDISQNPASRAGAWVLGMLLMGAGWVTGVAGGLLVLFMAAGWPTDGSAVNPNIPLFFMLGAFLCGAGLCLGLMGRQMWKRIGVLGP